MSHQTLLSEVVPSEKNAPGGNRKRGGSQLSYPVTYTESKGCLHTKQPHKLAIETVIADYGYGALTFNEVKELRSYDEVEHAGIWHIVGKGEAYTQCGKFVWKGCFNNYKHKNGKNFRKGTAISCSRAECPVCFLNWVTKQAHIIKDRLKDSRSITRNYRGRVIHLMISFNDEKSLTEFKYKNSYHKLRTRVYDNLKRVGADGGSIIPHPFRHDYDNERDYEMNDQDISIYKGDWHYAPHFHYMGYGWIRFDCDNSKHRGKKCVFYNNGKVKRAYCVKHNFLKFGYVVKLIRIVEDNNLLTCAKYVLNHAGVQAQKDGKDYNNTISWFGNLSYNKLVLPSRTDEKFNVCPDCNEELHYIKWDNSDKEPPPEDELEHWDLPGDDWVICDKSMPENKPFMIIQKVIGDYQP